jgi:hypothetical protein
MDLYLHVDRSLEGRLEWRYWEYDQGIEHGGLSDQNQSNSVSMNHSRDKDIPDILVLKSVQAFVEAYHTVSRYHQYGSRVL